MFTPLTELVADTGEESESDYIRCGVRFELVQRDDDEASRGARRAPSARRY